MKTYSRDTLQKVGKKIYTRHNSVKLLKTRFKEKISKELRKRYISSEEEQKDF